MFPGSVHKEGEPILWEENGEPAAVDGGELGRRVRLVAAASLIARAWPSEGRRHDAALIVGGFLARAGVAEVEAALMVEGVLRAVGDPEWRDRLRGVKDARAHQMTTGKAGGLPKLRELLGKAAANKVADWLGYADRQHNTDGRGLQMLPPPMVPMAVARTFVEERCTHYGVLTLLHWRGGWWQWRSSHWIELEDRTVRSLLYAYTENAFYVTREWAGSLVA